LVWLNRLIIVLELLPFLESYNMVRAKKIKPTLAELIKIPPIHDIEEWVVVGIDPSLSRTGLCLLNNLGDHWRWSHIASLKPFDASYPTWVRAIMMAEYILASVNKLDGCIPDILGDFTPTKGLIITLEAPTPMNDHLNIVNKILHTIIVPGLNIHFKEVYIQHVNAMTMRSCFGLKATGNNKYENIQKAQEFAPAAIYPGIDSDSCDAILLSQFGRYTADFFLGKELSEIPDRIALALCDFTDVEKGKGRNAYVVKKGILYNPAYWFKYEPTEYSISIKDARIPPKKRLEVIKTII